MYEYKQDALINYFKNLQNKSCLTEVEYILLTHAVKKQFSALDRLVDNKLIGEEEFKLKFAVAAAIQHQLKNNRSVISSGSEEKAVSDGSVLFGNINNFVKTLQPIDLACPTPPSELEALLEKFETTSYAVRDLKELIPQLKGLKEYFGQFDENALSNSSSQRLRKAVHYFNNFMNQLPIPSRQEDQWNHFKQAEAKEIIEEFESIGSNLLNIVSALKQKDIQYTHLFSLISHYQMLAIMHKLGGSVLGAPFKDTTVSLANMGPVCDLQLNDAFQHHQWKEVKDYLNPNSADITDQPIFNHSRIFLDSNKVSDPMFQFFNQEGIHSLPHASQIDRIKKAMCDFEGKVVARELAIFQKHYYKTIALTHYIFDHKNDPFSVTADFKEFQTGKFMFEILLKGHEYSCNGQKEDKECETFFKNAHPEFTDTKLWEKIGQFLVSKDDKYSIDNLQKHYEGIINEKWKGEYERDIKLGLFNKKARGLSFLNYFNDRIDQFSDRSHQLAFYAGSF